MCCAVRLKPKQTELITVQQFEKKKQQERAAVGGSCRGDEPCFCGSSALHSDALLTHSLKHPLQHRA